MATFIIFPGTFYISNFKMLDGIEDEEERASWYSIIIILLFNVFDTVGRFMGGKFHLPGKTIITMSILRIVFVASTTLIAL
jgi:hypothetical protein